MSGRRGGHRGHRNKQPGAKASHVQKTNRKSIFRRINDSFSRWRKGWFIAALCFLFIIVATVSPVLYDMYKERKREKVERNNEYHLGMFLYTELHGHGTLEVKLADPRNMPPQDVDLAIHWQIVNLGLKPVQIVNYVVDIKSEGRWIRFRRVALQRPLYLIRRSPSHLQYIDVSNKCFDQAAQAKMLLPGDSIDGWIFLDMASAGDHHFILEQIRVAITDVENRVYNIFPRLISEGELKELRDNYSLPSEPLIIKARETY